MCVGVDPGTVNLGISVFLPKIAIELFQIKVERDDNPVERIRNTYKILSEVVNSVTYNGRICIEGASFADKYRQTELAEVRTACVFWGDHYNFTSQIVPPNVIRKKVFGSAKIKAHDYWTNLPPDCAAALSCAIYLFS